MPCESPGGAQANENPWISCPCHERGENVLGFEPARPGPGGGLQPSPQLLQPDFPVEPNAAAWGCLILSRLWRRVFHPIL